MLSVPVPKFAESINNSNEFRFINFETSPPKYSVASWFSASSNILHWLDGVSAFPKLGFTTRNSWPVVVCITSPGFILCHSNAVEK
jgi:hypothetical protein